MYRQRLVMTIKGDVRQWLIDWSRVPSVYKKRKRCLPFRLAGQAALRGGPCKGTSRHVEHQSPRWRSTTATSGSRSNRTATAGSSQQHRPPFTNCPSTTPPPAQHGDPASCSMLAWCRGPVTTQKGAIDDTRPVRAFFFRPLSWTTVWSQVISSSSWLSWSSSRRRRPPSEQGALRRFRQNGDNKIASSSVRHTRPRASPRAMAPPFNQHPLTEIVEDRLECGAFHPRVVTCISGNNAHAQPQNTSVSPTGRAPACTAMPRFHAMPARSHATLSLDQKKSLDSNHDVSPGISAPPPRKITEEHRQTTITVCRCRPAENAELSFVRELYDLHLPCSTNTTTIVRCQKAIDRMLLLYR